MVYRRRVKRRRTTTSRRYGRKRTYRRSTRRTGLRRYRKRRTTLRGIRRAQLEMANTQLRSLHEARLQQLQELRALQAAKQKKMADLNEALTRARRLKQGSINFDGNMYDTGANPPTVEEASWWDRLTNAGVAWKPEDQSHWDVVKEAWNNPATQFVGGLVGGSIAKDVIKNPSSLPGYDYAKSLKWSDLDSGGHFNSFMEGIGSVGGKYTKGAKKLWDKITPVKGKKGYTYRKDIPPERKRLFPTSNQKLKESLASWGGYEGDDEPEDKGPSLLDRYLAKGRKAWSSFTFPFKPLYDNEDPYSGLTPNERVKMAKQYAHDLEKWKGKPQYRKPVFLPADEDLNVDGDWSGIESISDDSVDLNIPPSMEGTPWNTPSKTSRLIRLNPEWEGEDEYELENDVPDFVHGSDIGGNVVNMDELM